MFVGKYSCVSCTSKLLVMQIKFQINTKFEFFLLQELQVTLLQLFFYQGLGQRSSCSIWILILFHTYYFQWLNLEEHDNLQVTVAEKPCFSFCSKLLQTFSNKYFFWMHIQGNFDWTQLIILKSNLRRKTLTLKLSQTNLIKLI